MVFDPSTFTIPGWPPEKSRKTTDYVDYTADDSLIKPKIPKTNDRDSVLVVANSGPGYFACRNEVRSTWGEVCLGYTLF